MTDAPAPAPQASSPITIGPFQNVPAPGSPIRSDWPQQISTYVTNLPRGRKVTVACPGTDQSGFGTTASDIAGSVAAWTVETGRAYKVTAQFVVVGTAVAPYNFYINTGAGVVLLRAIGHIPVAGAYQSIHAELILATLPVGTYSVKAQFNVAGGSGTVLANGLILVEDIGQ